MKSDIKKSVNLWRISTLIFAVALVGLSIAAFQMPISENVVSGEHAGKKAAEFLNKKADSDVKYLSYSDFGDLYEITLLYKGKEIPTFITKDGKYLVQGIVPVEEMEIDNAEISRESAGIPKSDIPSVELFVMSHCPYGLQMEKAILPVAKLLKDKINFEVKFVSYAMHPLQGEVEEQLNQYCIQKEQKSKYLDYLECFIDSGKNSNDCIEKAAINTEMLLSCAKKTDEEFMITKNLEDKSSWINGRFPRFEIHKKDNEKYGVRGSPTLVINGLKTTSERNSASLLNLICSSFNNPPEECFQKLSSDTPSPGFGFSRNSEAKILNPGGAGCGA